MIARLTPFLVLLLAVNAFGAGKVTIEGQAEEKNYTLVIEYLDSHTLRMNFPGQQGKAGYMLIRDNKVYTVANINNVPMVMDLGAMSKITAGMDGENNNQNQAAGPLNYEIIDIKDTGKTETVAGIKGHVYQIRVKDGTAIENEEIVFSSNPDIRAYSDAWRAAGKTMQQAMGRQLDYNNDLTHYMAKHKLGLLRYGQQYKVISIDTNKPSADHFTLPAPPMALPDFGSMFGGAADGATRPGGMQH